jgi:hypothetical protein
VAVEIFTNLGTGTVTSGGTGAPSAGTTETWSVTASVPLPAASSSATPPTQFHVTDTAPGKQAELVLVTNVSGTAYSVTRGAEGTTPVTHSAGFTVMQTSTAGFFSSLATTASPALTGTPTAPTQAAGDTSTAVATDAFAATAATASAAYFLRIFAV